MSSWKPAAACVPRRIRLARLLAERLVLRVAASGTRAAGRRRRERGDRSAETHQHTPRPAEGEPQHEHRDRRRPQTPVDRRRQIDPPRAAPAGNAHWKRRCRLRCGTALDGPQPLRFHELRRLEEPNNREGEAEQDWYDHEAAPTRMSASENAMAAAPGIRNTPTGSPANALLRTQGGAFV